MPSLMATIKCQMQPRRSHKNGGVWGGTCGCIEFGPIFLQFRLFNSKQFIWGLEPVKPPKYAHGCSIAAFYSQPEGRGFDSRSSRHVRTLGKSFTCSGLCASA